MSRYYIEGLNRLDRKTKKKIKREFNSIRKREKKLDYPRYKYYGESNIINHMELNNWSNNKRKIHGKPVEDGYDNFRTKMWLVLYDARKRKQHEVIALDDEYDQLLEKTVNLIEDSVYGKVVHMPDKRYEVLADDTFGGVLGIYKSEDN